MSAGLPRDVLRQVRKAALLPDGAGMTDGQLLDCFVARRDEAAFETLVRRHGPMVLGVCRRLLRHPQDAEDAFQATFLVLVRKAASIARRELVGNWLYGVAYRTALEARAAAARRRTRERQVSPMPEPAADEHADGWRELRPLLDRELSRLPDKYRVAVVLCDLRGETLRDVARQLGVPTGTLSGRLTTARRLLAKRLARHGLAPSGGALTAALSPSAASAGVPSPLVTSTVQVALRVAAGQVAAGAVSAQVATVAEGVLKAMLLRKLKVAAAVLVAAATVAGAAILAHQITAAESAWPGPLATHPDGDQSAPRVLKLGDRGRRLAWSPDGKTLVVVTKVEKTFLGFQYYRSGSAIELWDVETGRLTQTLAKDTGKGLAFQQVAYARDGKTLAATASEVIQKGDSLEIRDVVKVWDARTGALRQALGGVSQLVSLALSPDGSLVIASDPSKKTLQVWDADTGTLQQTLRTGEAQPWYVAFSPDGTTLAVAGQLADHSGEVQWWDAQTWELKHASKQEHYVNMVAFSADGKGLAGVGGGDRVQLWDAHSGDLLRSIRGVGAGTRSVAFSPDGRTLAAGSTDYKVRLWDVQTGKLKKTLKGHKDQIYAVAFSPDGKTLASTGQDQTLRLWSLGKGTGERE